MARLLVVAAIGALVATAAAFDNMNGDYQLTKTPNAPQDRSFPTNYKDYPGGVEYFEVYHGPIKSVYSEVFWTTLSNDIPKEIVDRFHGKAMAIVGLEMDQVRRTPEGDVSVPITMAYNHHHDTAVVGRGTHLEKVPMSDPRVQAAGRNFVRLDKGQAWLPVEHAPSANGVPTSAMFSDGNGGEYRKSMHVLAPPYAQIVESPYKLSGSPMQIDTWNRADMPINGSGPFVPGPYPKHALAPKEGPDAIYSGLLECPLTTRITKVHDGGNAGFNDTFHPEVFACDASSNRCKHSVSTAEECFAAARQALGPNVAITNASGTSDSAPAGCTVAATDSTGKAVKVFFNVNDKSSACCGAGLDVVTGVSTSPDLVNVSLSLSASKQQMTLVIEGPAAEWFGVGFNATAMQDTPYTIVVDGNTGKVSERRLADHAAGTIIHASVTVKSNTVFGGRRTVTLTRPLTGESPQHFTFDPRALELNLILAVGSTPEISYHKARGTVTLAMWPANQAPVCLCTLPGVPFGQGTGKVCYGDDCVGFINVGSCEPSPRGSLLDQRNPTCDLRTYVGGLCTCHHSWLLLDAEQQVPWQDQPLVYYKKFRIYFQEYNASFHKQIRRADWGIGADHDHAEYDVPQCAPGTPTEQCTHEIQGTWVPVTAKNTYLVAAHMHCHAPTCLRVELWNNETGELMCRQEPIYGGTGKIHTPKFDEPGYIATPPCLWGSPEDGLQPPPLVSGLRMQVVAVTNSTYGHHGEMALPEMSLVTL